MYLFVFEFLGTTELLVILVVALIVFGPRKLPQLSRSLGKSLSEFRRASEDFKRTWEREVALDEVGAKPGEPAPAVMPPTIAPAEYSIGRSLPGALPDAYAEPVVSAAPVEPAAVVELTPAVPASAPPTSSKRDWL